MSTSDAPDSCVALRDELDEVNGISTTDPELCQVTVAALKALTHADWHYLEGRVAPRQYQDDPNLSNESIAAAVIDQFSKLVGAMATWREARDSGGDQAEDLDYIRYKARNIDDLCTNAFGARDRGNKWSELWEGSRRTLRERRSSMPAPLRHARPVQRPPREMSHIERLLVQLDVQPVDPITRSCQAMKVALLSLASGNSSTLTRAWEQKVRTEDGEHTVGYVLQQDLERLPPALSRYQARDSGYSIKVAASERINKIVTEMRNVLDESVSGWRSHWDAAAAQNKLPASAYYDRSHLVVQSSLARLRYHPLDRRQISRGL